MLPTSKQTVRRETFAALRALPPAARAAASASICRHVAASPGWAPGATVLLFAALPSEPDLTPLIGGAPPGARLLFPLVTDAATGAMSFHHVRSERELAARTTRIPEPDPAASPEVSPAEVTVAFVPGVAFDPETGLRLGRGGGFYDRLLARPDFTAPATGVCFALQQRTLAGEIHDQAVGSLVTEKGRFALPAA